MSKLSSPVKGSPRRVQVALEVSGWMRMVPVGAIERTGSGSEHTLSEVHACHVSKPSRPVKGSPSRAGGAGGTGLDAHGAGGRHRAHGQRLRAHSIKGTCTARQQAEQACKGFPVEGRWRWRCRAGCAWCRWAP